MTDYSKAKRDTNWTYVPSGDKMLLQYIKVAYKTAFIRIKTDYLTSTSFRQYFQISWTTPNGVHGFKSFPIYGDAEENDIKEHFPKIEDLVTYPSDN